MSFSQNERFAGGLIVLYRTLFLINFAKVIFMLTKTLTN